MKKIILSLATIASLSLLQANDAFSEYAVSVKGGTLGVGAELTTNITENINGRLSVSGFNFNTATTDSDIQYDVDLDLLNIALIADYYAFDSSEFRFSAGVMYNGNQLNLNGTPSSASTFTIGDTVYTTADVSSVHSTVDYNKIAPYLGVGWGNAVQSAGWNFVADLGVMYQGNANVSVTTNTTLTGAALAQLEAEVANKQRDLENTLSKYKFYPVATIGVSYRF